MGASMPTPHCMSSPLKALTHAAWAGESVITVYERAMAQVWLRLEAIAQQHGVAEALQVFVRVRC